jgi:flagellar biosynthesis/type III secretory pathway protein FliH
MSSSDPTRVWDPPALVPAGARKSPAPARPGASSAADGWDLPELSGVFPAPAAGAEPGAEVYDRGYADGVRAGIARGEERLQAAIRTLQEGAAALAAARVPYVQDLERNLHALALAVARKLVLREIEADPAITTDLVRRALALVEPEAPLTVRLHPADLEPLREPIAALAAGEGIVELRWVADPALERGSLLLEGPQRVVDGRIDEALHSFYERLGHE